MIIIIVVIAISPVRMVIAGSTIIRGRFLSGCTRELIRGRPILDGLLVVLYHDKDVVVVVVVVG